MACGMARATSPSGIGIRMRANFKMTSAMVSPFWVPFYLRGVGLAGSFDPAWTQSQRSNVLMWGVSDLCRAVQGMASSPTVMGMCTQERYVASLSHSGVGGQEWDSHTLPPF